MIKGPFFAKVSEGELIGRALEPISEPCLAGPELSLFVCLSLVAVQICGTCPIDSKNPRISLFAEKREEEEVEQYGGDKRDLSFVMPSRYCVEVESVR
ncbi:hypothetical protein GUJ93_ZPchr0013g36204 [Zizania palustris]|uniref:Uncharacterized protein n=1 Tax=Zizania palustris TaxID=103762 RepID=A0A8J5WUU9_ZIZPA|nr:hypothetical protein GUJ93_ZPchr0013g36204 [Zizania palustris]